MLNSTIANIPFLIKLLRRNHSYLIQIMQNVRDFAAAQDIDGNAAPFPAENKFNLNTGNNIATHCNIVMFPVLSL